MTSWGVVLDVAVTLGVATLLGVLAMKVRQSALLGYLVAGILVGPSGFGFVGDFSSVEALAELGVAMLLFAIGLEFSWNRLKRIGIHAWAGGVAQVTVTTAIVTAICMAFGLPASSGFAVGCVVALSSTAIVLRSLNDAGDLDSVHGKAALGVLLLQDMAVVPMVALLAVMGKGGESAGTTLNAAARTGVTAGVFVVGFLVLKYVLPRILFATASTLNRELPVLTAFTTCVAAAWGAHVIGISPAVGAFVVGLMLSETPYAEQLRADVDPFKAVFVTLFFTTIGMVADLKWIVDNASLVLLTTVAIMIGKVLLVAVVLRLFRLPLIASIAAAIALSQIGEFSFVLAQSAVRFGLIQTSTFQLLAAATLITLLAAPYLVQAAPTLGRSIGKRLAPARVLAREAREAARAQSLKGHVLLVGYGDCGRAASKVMAASGFDLFILDLHPALVQSARDAGHKAMVGDATMATILNAANLEGAAAAIIAIPDHRTSRLVIRQMRASSSLPIVARSRYSAFRQDLEQAGASKVIDEEIGTGIALGSECVKSCGSRAEISLQMGPQEAI